MEEWDFERYLEARGIPNQGPVMVPASVCAQYGLPAEEHRGRVIHIKRGDGSPYPIVVRLDCGPTVQYHWKEIL